MLGAGSGVAAKGMRFSSSLLVINFTSWLALFVAQTILVLSGRTAVHRRLGVAGVVLAALMLVVGTATSITVTRLGHRGIPGVEFPNPDGFLLLNLAALFVFTTLFAAGWWRAPVDIPATVCGRDVNHAELVE